MSSDIITLKGGKRYPLFTFTLNEAHDRGLRRLEVEVLQFPTAENGHHAICRATAEFEDGRLFTDIGDAVPMPNSPQVRPLALASTRAQGRVLRSACNIGEAMAEDDAEEPRAVYRGEGGQSEAGVCEAEGCGSVLTAGQQEVSRRNWGKAMCPHHQRLARGVS